MTGLIEGMLTPSRRTEGGYMFFLVGFAHMGLGAAAHEITGLTVLVPLIYWAAKELRDLRHGGGFWDGITDAGFVGVGAAFASLAAPVWQWIVLGVAVTYARQLARGALSR